MQNSPWQLSAKQQLWLQRDKLLQKSRPDETRGEDFACFRFPGTQDQVTFNADQFAMFDQGGAVSDQQAAFARAVMSPEFQIAFNKVKGSVPARTDLEVGELDACGQQGYEDMKAAAESGNLIGSFAHGYGNPAAVKNAMYDVITAHFNGEYDSETAIQELQTAVEINAM